MSEIPNLEQAMARMFVKRPKRCSRWEKWIRWLDLIEGDPKNLAINQHVWHTLTTIWKETQPQLSQSL